MAVDIREWLDLLDREYLRDFVTGGGGAIKFAVVDDRQLSVVVAALGRLAGQHGLRHVAIDAATSKLHMIQDIFYAVARSLDWDEMAQKLVESMFNRQGYDWPHPGEATPIKEVARLNRVDETILRREYNRWLSEEVMRDSEMAQDFRIAMTRLCQRRLWPEDTQPGITVPVLEWLQGDLSRISALRDTFITAKITRHNGRAMLRSLCHWVRLCGYRGLCVTLDIRQLGRTGAALGNGLKYSTAAVMDGFEVLRQLIDDAEHFAGLLAIVLADEVLVGDDRRRSLAAYTALKMRVWDDVRPEGRDNPLAPLVRLVGGPNLETVEGGL